MHAIRLTAAAASLLLLGLDAAAAEGLYIGVHGGSNVTLTSDIDDPSLQFNELSYEPGFAVGGTIGYKWSFRLRTEVEFAYRRNGVDEFDIAGIDYPAEGDVTSMSFMANAFYDFDNRSRWTPYVGGGLGAVKVSWDDVEAPAFAGGTLIDDGDTVFAAQFGAGVGFAITEALTLSFDYRALATEEIEITEETGTDIDIDYLNSSVWLGLRYTF